MGRVACDGDAVAASQQLHAVIGGPFEEVLAQFRAQGAILGDPVHWDGRHAIEFRSAWERAEADLRNFHGSLQEVLAAALRVQGDILSAGGN
ncbi:MAG TPA: hypothetical protein VHA73_01870 [Acidimicrobiales bacterium]|jgi:hypothetical protein|nr:hypothetical protein [Acidimicrobiales bacterium]